MRPSRGAPLIASLLFILSLGFCFTAIASGDGKKTLKREMDPVIVTGAQCLPLIGQPIGNFGLFAFRNGILDAIPFQIDEVDGSGHFVLTHGQGKAKDSDKGHFDANDQLVFMALDTGDHMMHTHHIPDTVRGCMEIAVTDPLTGEKGWVYLMTFSNPPPRSTVTYVRYDPNNLQVVARNYSIEFNKRFPVAGEKYAFGKAIGGDETAITDRVKVRIHMKLLAAFDKSEEDIAVKEIGSIDGPVRAIVRESDTMSLFLRIPATKTVGDTLFYYSFADFPFIVDQVVRPTAFRVKMYDDFINLAGWTFYSSTNPKGHLIDGVMDDKDKGVDLSPWKWLVISNDRLAFWSTALYPPGCPVHANLYYNDDSTARNLPESVPGEVPGLGWDFSEGWDKVTRFPLELRLVHFFTKAYTPGDENAVVNIHDHPLETEVKQIR
jgi:hypothetical protein